jgi:hypothetical protein
MAQPKISCLSLIGAVDAPIGLFCSLSTQDRYGNKLCHFLISPLEQHLEYYHTSPVTTTSSAEAP